MNKYTKFCTETYGSATPLPPTRPIILMFVAYMHENSLQSSTMSGIISGVRRQALLDDQEDFFVNGEMPYAIASALTGAKRLFSTTKKAAALRENKRVAATTAVVRRLLAAAPSCMEPNDAIRFRLVTILCFLGGFRCGEVLAATPSTFNPLKNLCMADTVPEMAEGEPALAVSIKQNKVDQFAHGRRIHIVAMPDDADFSILSAWSTWVQLRLHMSLGDAQPLFVNDNGSAFSYQCFSTLLQRTCVTAGLSAAKITSHSFRKGGATVLAARGQGDAAILNYGGWSGGKAFTKYVSPSTSLSFRSQRCIASYPS